jgi:glycosyltransferase involved in cell wall biosynthesis
MLPPISVVVIGMNEAEHLEACFKAIRASDYPGECLELIYVDSGSTDQSIEIAHKYTSSVHIEPEWPTAARNRNRGLIESKYNIVHFIDGDIIIDADYLRSAVERLLKEDIQCVFGRLEEKNTKGIGGILLHDYSNREPGYIDAPGAGGTFLQEPLININGWDERIPRGEETELGDRLKKAGFKIWYLDCKMGVHDYGIKTFRGFIKKQISEGQSFGAISLIPSDDMFFHRMKKTIRNNIFFHILILSLIILSFVIGSSVPILAGFFSYPAYIIFKYRILRGVCNLDSLKYFLFTNLTRTAMLFGFLKFRIRFYSLPKGQKLKFDQRMDIPNILRERHLKSCKSK